MLLRLMGYVTTAVLVAMVAGVVAWFGFSALTQATLITFRTGSMAPTMPQGSLALTLPVNAQEIQVGDVITVQRDGTSLPVTHRVVEANPAPQQAIENGAGPDAREIILKGDDNTHPDHRPYVITSARKVVFSLPRVGQWLHTLKSPPAMALLIVGAGVLTTWAFWPTTTRK